jgi:hypothetical protein
MSVRSIRLSDAQASLDRGREAMRRPSPPPHSSAAWHAYFAARAQTTYPFPWERGAELTAAEREAIAASVQKFQLGESGQGSHFLGCAAAYAVRTGDWDYFEALRLFIREEQRHARDLGRFLELAGVPLLCADWSNGWFRWLRKRAGLELIVTVLVSAEVLAKVYYAALRKATGSVLLRRLCEQILRDEVAHVRFQSERLALLRRGRSGWRLAVTRGLQGVLFAGTALVVWRGHRRALRAGGYDFPHFWRSAWREYAAVPSASDHLMEGCR